MGNMELEVCFDFPEVSAVMFAELTSFTGLATVGSGLLVVIWSEGISSSISMTSSLSELCVNF